MNDIDAGLLDIKREQEEKLRPKWFHAYCYGKIEQTNDVTGETDSFVILANGRKEKKSTDWHYYSKSKEVLKNWRIQLATRELQKAQLAVQQANEKLEQANAL